MSDLEPRFRVAEWIEKAMKEAGIGQRELAERMGVQRPTASRIVNGKRNIRVDTLFDAIEACGFEIVELRVRKKV